MHDHLAERLGTATRNLQRIESGRQNLTLETIERIAAALGVDPCALLPGTPEGPLTVGADGRTPRVVPVIDLRAVAGLLHEPRSVTVEGGWVIDAPAGGTLFVARIEGDSMEPAVPSGSFALFEAPAGPVDAGAVVLWQVRKADAPDDGGSYLLKRFGERLADRNEVTLRSINRRHPTQFHSVHSPDDLRAVARFVRVVG